VINVKKLRWATAILAISAGMAAPSSALAHGIAHERLSEPSSHHDHHEHSTFMQAVTGLSFVAPDHAHASVEVITPGQAFRFILATPQLGTLLPDIAVRALPGAAMDHWQAAADPTGTPPPHLRGPPLL
jgi:hypothetical protein